MTEGLEYGRIAFEFAEEADRLFDPEPSQRDVLTWAAAGKSAWEMGEILNISARTVEEHAQQALQRLGAVNRTQAVAIAIRDRLIAI